MSKRMSTKRAPRLDFLLGFDYRSLNKLLEVNFLFVHVFLNYYFVFILIIFSPGNFLSNAHPKYMFFCDSSSFFFISILSTCQVFVSSSTHIKLKLKFQNIQKIFDLYRNITIATCACILTLFRFQPEGKGRVLAKVFKVFSVHENHV